MCADGTSTPTTVAEHRALLAARRGACPYLVMYDADGAQHLIVLDGGVERLTIGREDGVSIQLSWDPRVSRVHAVLEHVGSDWVVSDDGLSRNGTFVNEVRIVRTHRLKDGDVIRVGHSTITFSLTAPGHADATTPADEPEVRLTPAQLRILVALCRPYLTDGAAALPASNEQIAAELFLSLDAVKAHLRNLFRVFSLDGFPQMQKRVALARMAMESGIVRRGE